MQEGCHKDCRKCKKKSCKLNKGMESVHYIRKKKSICVLKSILFLHITGHGNDGNRN